MVTLQATLHLPMRLTNPLLLRPMRPPPGSPPTSHAHRLASRLYMYCQHMTCRHTHHRLAKPTPPPNTPFTPLHTTPPTQRTGAMRTCSAQRLPCRGEELDARCQLALCGPVSPHRKDAGKQPDHRPHSHVPVPAQSLVDLHAQGLHSRRVGGAACAMAPHKTPQHDRYRTLARSLFGLADPELSKGVRKKLHRPIHALAPTHTHPPLADPRTSGLQGTASGWQATTGGTDLVGVVV